MSLIADALGEQLRINSGCIAIFGNRVYAETIPPEAAHPAIWYSLVSDIPSSWVASWRSARVQVTVVASTNLEANSGAEAVISAVTLDLLNAGQPKSWTASTSTFTVDTCIPQDGPRNRDILTGLISIPVDFLVSYRK
jgi:hypothetical protein